MDLVDTIKPCSKLPAWDWRKGDPYIDNSIAPPAMKRTYFDCAEYFFDGVFNVVKFPKGMTLYHGSAVLANANADLPIGREYYEPYDGVKARVPSQEIGLKLTNPQYPSWIPLQYEVSQHFNISAGWYGDHETAKLYSVQTGSSDKTLASNCGAVCINAYSLRHDVVMVLLDDDFNIRTILAKSDQIVPPEIKQYLRNMFQLQSDIPMDSAGQKPFNRVLYLKTRKSYRDYDLPFAEWFCKNVITPQGYSGYCAPIQAVSQAQAVFHMEFIFCNATKWLYRNYQDPRDWQTQARIQVPPAMGSLLVEYHRYKTLNVDFHAGNLVHHSIWTVLYTEHFLKKLWLGRGFNTIPTNTQDTFKIVVLAAYLHDVGKIRDPSIPSNSYLLRNHEVFYYDIPNHPEVGARYILNGSIPSAQGPISVNQIITEANMKSYDNKGVTLLLAFIILLHWKLGSHVGRIASVGGNVDYTQVYTDYINDCIATIRSFFGGPSPALSAEWLAVILKATVIVSIADIYAMQSYGYDRLKKKKRLMLNKQSYFFPYITNVSKIYRGSRMFIDNIAKYGIPMVGGLFSFIDTHAPSILTSITEKS